MSGINLLPPWLIEKQRLRRLFKNLAAAQGVILIASALIFWLFNVLIEKAAFAADTLTVMLADERFAESESMAELERSSNLLADLNAQLSQKNFNPAWLADMNTALPSGIVLTDIHINDINIALSCLVNDWGAMASYRDALLKSDYFSEARFGKFTVLEDGFIRCEINIWAGP